MYSLWKHPHLFKLEQIESNMEPNIEHITQTHTPHTHTYNHIHTHTHTYTHTHTHAHIV